MRHLDLFSGIGGFALAAQWTWGDEYETVAFCEIDKFCHKVFRKNFGDVPIYEDIKKLDGTKLTSIDLLTGGFPCQPFSVAGKRKGNEDDRALWPEMLRIIQEVKPRWIIGENVAGFVNMALDQSITDLENEGYEVQAFIIPACAVNAPHRRDRVWIVANNNNTGNRASGSGIDRDEPAKNKGRSKLTQSESIRQNGDASHTGREYGARETLGREHEEADRQRSAVEFERSTTRDGNRIISNPQSKSDGLDQTKHEGRQDDTGRSEQADTDRSGKGLERKKRAEQQGISGRFASQNRGQSELWNENWYEVATRFCRVDDGVPNRVDRLKSLGNAIVPQVAYEIMKAIKEIDQK